jgi:hypothetical protein
MDSTRFLFARRGLPHALALFLLLATGAAAAPQGPVADASQLFAAPRRSGVMSATCRGRSRPAVH